MKTKPQYKIGEWSLNIKYEDKTSWINFIAIFYWLPCFDLCGHYSPMFVVRGQNTYASLGSPRHIITFNFVVLVEEFIVKSVCLGDPDGFIDCYAFFINGSTF